MPFRAYSLFLFVDPALIAFPYWAQEADVATASIEKLTSLATLSTRYDLIQLASTTSLAAELGSVGFYPAHHELGRILHQLNLTEAYDVDQVRRVINSVVARCEEVDERVWCKEISLSGARARPSLTCLAGFPDLQILACQSMGRAAVEKAGGADVRSALSNAFPPSKSVRISARECLFSLADGTLKDVSPFAGYLTRFDDAVDFLKTVDATEVWRNAASETQIEFALVVKQAQIRASSGLCSTIDQLTRFALGPAFIASLSSSQAASSGKFSGAALDGCARLLAGLPKNPPQPLRVSAESAEQVKRQKDSALAHRLHPTKKGEALRLMFWETDEGIELSVIANKADVSIT